MMENRSRLSRRNFLAASAVLASAGAWASGPPPGAETSAPIPLKIGQRAVSMNMVGNFEIIKIAREVPGLMGIQLQITAGKPNLWDPDAVRRYKREANLWGMFLPSVAGVWSKGSSIRSPRAASDLVQAIRVSELLGASVILVAFFEHSAPDMNKESSYGSIVELLQKAAPSAADVGVTLGLENSLSPADNLKLIDLIDRPSVKVYYDVWNMAYYGYQAVPGISLLGKERICEVHVKNNNDGHRISGPGLIDWSAAFAAFNEIGYERWYVFEAEPASFTKHRPRSQMMEDTEQNIRFVKQHCRMAMG
ncbi:MAG: sugar phosphate isomerase/epimerase family protein [Terriglobia bacterium]